MTMTKGKKQQSEGGEDAISPRSAALLSDQEYGRLGSGVAAKQGPHVAREEVLVNPHLPLRGRLSIAQTALGRMPRSLLATFGLEDAFIDVVVEGAQPRCSRCDVLAHRSESVQEARWPDHGYIALVVDGVEHSVSLEQQCELLDVERAIVDGMLVRREEVAGREGEPVLNVVSIADRAQVSREVELWLARGGGPLRLMHYPSRNERGVEMYKLFRGWRCTSCGDSYPVASRQLIEDAQPCQRCRGEGWLLVEDDRFVACEDCDAFGRTTPLSQYEVSGTAFKDLSRWSFKATEDHLRRCADRRSADLLSRVSSLCDEGFAQYPIGMPVELLSRSEGVLATIASARLSGIAEVTLVVDAGALGVSHAWIRSIVQRNQLPALRMAQPVTEVGAKVECRKGTAHVLTLRDVALGPLSIPNVTFDIGGLTALQGEPGVGKSLLLKEIARRFAKRRKLAHLGSFGGLKRCHHIHADSVEGDTVMDLLGISELVAAQAASTRHARERSLLKDDFLVSRSSHRCEGCRGVSSLDNERCSQCDGGLFDRLAGSVVVNNLPFADLVRGSLAQAGEVLWSDDELSGMLARVPEDLKGSLSLGGSASALDLALQRFLSVAGPMWSILGRREGLEGELMLIDVPFGTTTSYQRIVIQCINELRSRGATIVCAGVPETLENIFSSVVRLRFVTDPQLEEGTQRFLDRRMTRKSEVVIER
ncbi:MAG: hypothetical protein RL518_2632 [Pseudomonadota bacterium]